MNPDLVRIAYAIPAVLIGLTVHEFAHAGAALALGDRTAYNEGRVSLNPLRHLDPLGFAFIVIAGFGWAKPVRFDPANLRHPRRDRALIAVAGPVSNLLLGIVTALILRSVLSVVGIAEGSPIEHALNFLLFFTLINFGLFVFNMIPIPPLDGSHVLLLGLNVGPETEARILRFGGLALLAVILIERQAGVAILPIGAAVRALMNLFF